MVKNTNFTGSLDTNPYKFRHYYITHFTLFVYGKQFPREDQSLGLDHDKTSVMGNRGLFEASGILYSNSRLQIAHDIRGLLEKYPTVFFYANT